MLLFFLRNYWLLEKPHSSKAIGRLTTAQQEGDGSVFYFVKMFGISLGLTILIELAVAAPFGMRTRKKILLVLLVNVLTNPPAVLAYWLLGRFRRLRGFCCSCQLRRWQWRRRPLCTAALQKSLNGKSIIRLR